MGFEFQFNIENFGTIKDAVIDIKPLTIIAGKNSSGKTFITKSLYAILNAVKLNHFYKEIDSIFTNLEKYYFYVSQEIILQRPANVDSEFVKIFEEYLEYYAEIIAVSQESTIEEQISYLEEESSIIKNCYDFTIDYFNKRKTLKKFKKNEGIVNRFIELNDEFYHACTHHGEIIIESLSNTLNNNIKQNFQITNTDSLIRFGSKKSSLAISTIGTIGFENKKPLEFSLTYDGIKEIQKLSNIVFFDSPIYTRIRKSIEKSNKRSFSFNLQDNENYLKGYPEYIDNLYDFLDKQYTEEPMFDDLSKSINDMISGKLIVNKSGEIVYEDNDNNSIPLSLTAMGIGNIGIIDILLRNNTIRKGSFLIMDEPEVHLHPTWQVNLAKILYEISKRGVNIILATHSLDLIKAFQVAFENNFEESEKIVAVNCLPFNKKYNKMNSLDKLNKILDELSEPYYNLYMDN